jgi:hypothetical protein
MMYSSRVLAANFFIEREAAGKGYLLIDVETEGDQVRDLVSSLTKG